MDVSSNDNFKAWFSDSKMVDESGKPLIVYHRSRSHTQFTEFRHTDVQKNGLNDDYGFYFTGQHSKNYVQHLGNGVEILAYLRISKPFYITEYKPGKITDHDGNPLPFIQLTKDYCMQIKEKGYDGVVIQSNVPNSYTQFVCFEPNQIKHINNTGAFSATNPNMYE